ncbi:hypothetical protein BLNAU_20235 [Blattamonas nauphoetae]|uniref:Uncharacterized protein n=1 Tax=Blattamonas nauphoetae TaxID=2049346 RepID=A0ABQ9WZU8_9EUKA|nr:hypothetical protein BLNAU_20235 [Blattamonas nauphoetae]
MVEENKQGLLERSFDGRPGVARASAVVCVVERVFQHETVVDVWIEPNVHSWHDLMEQAERDVLALPAHADGEGVAVEDFGGLPFLGLHKQPARLELVGALAVERKELDEEEAERSGAGFGVEVALVLLEMRDDHEAQRIPAEPALVRLVQLLVEEEGLQRDDEGLGLWIHNQNAAQVVRVDDARQSAAGDVCFEGRRVEGGVRLDKLDDRDACGADEVCGHTGQSQVMVDFGESVVDVAGLHGRGRREEEGLVDGVGEECGAVTDIDLFVDQRRVRMRRHPHRDLRRGRGRGEDGIIAKCDGIRVVVVRLRPRREKVLCGRARRERGLSVG